MADLSDLYRILYFLYEGYPENRRVTLEDLQTNSELRFMDQVGNLAPSIKYLKKTGYVEGPDDDLQLTGEGLRATISMFQKFLKYIKRDYPYKLSNWINIFDFHKDNNWDFIRNAFFYIHNEPLVRAAFGNYLTELGYLENLGEFEILTHDIGSFIENIFFNLDEINNLFKYRFKCNLFCPPVAAQSVMSRATRGREVNLTDLVAAIGSILDSVCNNEIDPLLDKAAKGIAGSINKIESLLKSNGIQYKHDTLRTLRTLHHIRSTIFPIHNAGPEIIGYLKELNVEYPIGDTRETALRILRSFNSALLEMKVWFLPDHNVERFDYPG